jgi:hypothetical protein
MKQDGLTVDLKTVVLLVIFVNLPFWVMAFFTLDQTRNVLSSEQASDFRAIARRNALTINYGVNHLVMELGTLAINTQVREVVHKQNSTYPGTSEGIQKKVQGIEKIWLTPQANSIVSEILGDPASRYLRQFMEVNRSFKRVTVTDRFGGVAAASTKTIDFDQGDEVWWQHSYKDGIVGAVVIEDVTFDPITKLNALHIVVPIQEEGKDQIIGVIGALVDISDLFPLASGVKIGSTGETLLVKDDGTILAGREGNLSPGEKLPYMDDIHNAQRTTLRPDFIQAIIPGGKQKVVSYQECGLATNYPDLKWWALVAQDSSEANAAIDTMTRKLLWAAIIVLIIITGLALYFSTHQRLHFTDLREEEAE